MLIISMINKIGVSHLQGWISKVYVRGILIVELMILISLWKDLQMGISTIKVTHQNKYSNMTITSFKNNS